MNWFKKFKVILKSLLQQGLSESEFNGNLVYKLEKHVSRAEVSDKFRKVTHVLHII